MSLPAKRAGICTAALAALALTPLAAQAERELTVWGLQSEGIPEFYAAVKERFEAANPDVSVNLQFTPNEAYKTAIQVALVGSQPPDVFFNWAGEDSARLVRDGLVLDLTDMANAEGGFATVLSDSWLDVLTYDGRIYGVPTEAVTKYFYYDTTFFDEHGLSEPSDFDGLLGLCRQIREIEPKLSPIVLGNSERWQMNHYITVINERVLGIEATEADYALTAEEDALFADPGYVEAWQKVVDMKEAGCFQDAPNATSPETAWSMFSSQLAPMTFCGSWCADIFDNAGFRDYKMFRFPAIAGGAGSANTNMVVPQGLQVSAKTPEPELATAWLSFMTSDETAKLQAEMMKNLPSNPALIDEVSDATEQYRFIVNDLSSLEGSFNVIDVAVEASVANAYLDAGVEVLNGTKTPQEAMDMIREAALAAKAAQ